VSTVAQRTQLLVVVSALIALALKLVIAMNTFGTNDVIALYQFGACLTQHGLYWTYKNVVAFNHPPLVAYFLQATFRLSQLPLLLHNGLTFPFWIRLPGIFADFIGVLVVLAVSRQLSTRIPVWALHVFALSPVSLMITGFHGNTDPLMVLFLSLATYMVFKNRPIGCGLFLALSCQIKIIPLLLLPIFIIFWASRRSFVKFSVPFTLCMVIGWLEPLTQFPILFCKSVLSYGSFWGLWGITYWLRLTGWWQFEKVTFHDLLPAENVVATVLKLLIIAGVLLIAWRRRHGRAEDLCYSIGYAWIIFFVFSPGVCAQYMVWLAPSILLLSPPLFGWLTAASSLFLFFFYNTIAHGLPWYLGISQGKDNEKWLPWSIWPWGVLIAAMLVLWRNKRREDPGFYLFSLKPIGHPLPLDAS
jgi:Gpi18-like mannosyltransferase